MHPPSRTRRILKWTGTSLSLALLATWIASCLYLTEFNLPGGVFGYIVAGVLAVQTSAPTVNSPPYIAVPCATPMDVRVQRIHYVDKIDFNSIGFIGPSYESTISGQDCTVSRVSTLALPFWLLLLLTTIPTAWLWHRDWRRVRPGCCLRCGYDLTGNTSGTCSECGLAKPPLSQVEVRV